MNNIITFLSQSSEDPTKTSATLTGILIGLAAWIQQYGSAIPGINTFFASPAGQQIDLICTDVGMVVGGIWALFGLFRKLTNKIESAKGLRVS